MTMSSPDYQHRLHEWQRLRAGDGWVDWSIVEWLDRCVAAQGRFIELASGDAAAKAQHDVGHWQAVTLFEQLAFFGQFGALLAQMPIAERAGWIATSINHARRIIELAPRDCGDDNAVHILTLAAGRQMLDAGQGVLTPTALGLLGDLSEGRVRNLMSGAQAQLTSVQGGIAVAEAREWLGARPAFRSSIWQIDFVPGASAGHEVRVPQAIDQSVFHPGLRRRNGFTIGAKGEEVTLPDFDAALAALSEMKEPRWRRPNDQGNWGIVKASGWITMPRDQLDLIR